MLTTFKKAITKSVMTRMVIALIVVIGLLAYVNASLLALIKGPVIIKEGTELESLEGQYVQFTAQYFVNEYVRQSSKTEGRNDEKLKNIGYLLFDDVNGYFFGVEVPAKYEADMTAHIEETWTWLNQEDYQVVGSETFKGTWTELTGKRLQYFKETLTENLGEEFMEAAVPYYIDTNYIADKKVTQVRMALIASGAVFLYMIFILIRFFGNSHAVKIKKFLQNNTGITMAQLEADFQSAVKISNIWVGQRCTFYRSGIYVEVVDNTKLVWAYYYWKSGRNSVSQLRAFDANKKSHFINASEKEAKQIMGIYSNAQPQILLGFDKEWEKLFDKDFQGFLNLRYNQAMSQLREDNFMHEPQVNDTYVDERQAETAPEGVISPEPDSSINSQPEESNTETAKEEEPESSVSDLGSSYGSDLGSSFSGFDSFSSFDSSYGSDSSSEEEKSDEEENK